jgi:hypothetical protein
MSAWEIAVTRQVRQVGIARHFTAPINELMNSPSGNIAL